MMKSKINFLTVIVTLLIFFNSFSQNAHNLVRNNDRASLQDVAFLLSSNLDETDAEGSPYISDDFSPIRIKGYNNIFSGRFNAYSNQMQVKIDDDKIIYLDNEKFYQVTFTILNKIYKTCSYINEEGEQKRGFLEIIHIGDGFTLLKKEVIKFYDKVPPKSGYESEKPAQFKKENDKFYIYLKGSDAITYMPIRKKSLLKSFPEKSKSLKKFIKDNKINTKEEGDLIKVAEHLSSL